MPHKIFTVTTTSPAETERLGRELGSMLAPGVFLALKGELGGGKTCFTRGVVAGAAPESAAMVASPTFAIMNEYVGAIPVFHFDFYRLSGSLEIAELGFEDYFQASGICIAEWAERLEELIPPDHLSISFKYAEQEHREIQFEASGPVSSAILAKLFGKL
jgi:tRNA threonylcarbamoyladenosine biosynthesis protein TsaE